MILDSPTSLLHQGSPSSWIFATKGVLKSPGELLESSLKGLMVKISSFINFLPLKLMLVENLAAVLMPTAERRLTTARAGRGQDGGPGPRPAAVQRPDGGRPGLGCWVLRLRSSTESKPFVRLNVSTSSHSVPCAHASPGAS